MDPYSVLGVSVNATERELRAAYRERMKYDHQDRPTGSKEAAQRDNWALETALANLKKPHGVADSFFANRAHARAEEEASSFNIHHTGRSRHSPWMAAKAKEAQARITAKYQKAFAANDRLRKKVRDNNAVRLMRLQNEYEKRARRLGRHPRPEAASDLRFWYTEAVMDANQDYIDTMADLDSDLAEMKSDYAQELSEVRAAF